MLPRPPLTDPIAIAVNEVLYDHWDPLGICGVAPRDEYETYVPELIGLARAGETAEVIAARLGYISDQLIGLGQVGPETHRLTVAQQILAVIQAN